MGLANIGGSCNRFLELPSGSEQNILEDFGAYSVEFQGFRSRQNDLQGRIRPVQTFLGWKSGKGFQKRPQLGFFAILEMGYAVLVPKKGSPGCSHRGCCSDNYRHLTTYFCQI